MMNRFAGMAALALVAAAGAVAQDGGNEKQMKAQLERLLVNARTISLEGAVMGQPVKGAPYSATEVTETTQALADGTHIHNVTQTKVWRDGEGRTRREMPNEVTIMDPVANLRYALHPDSQTATKVQVGNVGFAAAKTPAGNENVRVFVTGGGGGSVTSEHTVVMRTDQGTSPRMATTITSGGKSVDGDSKHEDLGQQVMEGVPAQGTRLTTTIPANAIGNDRPIQSTFERWFSPELKIQVMSRNNDPRTGEVYFHLDNLKLGEPDPSLFQVPAGYQVNGLK